MLQDKFFGHCAGRKETQDSLSFELIWEFTKTFYAYDIVSYYVAYRDKIVISYSNMLLNKLQK